MKLDLRNTNNDRPMFVPMIGVRIGKVWMMRYAKECWLCVGREREVLSGLEPTSSLK